MRDFQLFEDGIGVKRQKDRRKNPDYEKPTKRVQTDILALEQPNQGYRYMCPLLPQNESCSPPTIDDIVRAEWTITYGGIPKNLVVISDGAKNIRDRLQRIFNQTPVIILDWYHLKKKVGEFFSMMGLKKEKKKEHIQNILHHLWHGRYESAHTYIHSSVKPLKTRYYKKEELLQYLHKHKVEIIDYDRRKRNKKTVGSSRAETTVNQVVGVRQKKKGSSWTPNGSRALAIMRTFELNKEFSLFWENQRVA